MWVIIGLSFLQVLLNRLLDGEVDPPKLNDVLLGMLGNQTLFMVIVPAMLLVRDFTQNTVRNKIICGHSRTNIYIAHLICFDAVALFYHYVATLASFVFGAIILGGVDTICHDFAAYYFIQSNLTILAYSSMTVFVCMMIRGVSGVIIAYVINSLLSTFGAIAMMTIHNEKIMDLVYCSILDMQSTAILEGMSQQEMPDTFLIYALPLCALAYIISLPIIGIKMFKTTDLK